MVQLEGVVYCQICSTFLFALDCTYAVRFDKNTDVEGYEPEKYLEMYQNAEGDTPQEKINRCGGCSIRIIKPR